MLKKFLCILMVCICVFCFCVSNPLEASAAFVVDDALIAAFLASLAASIVITTGWGVISNNPSVYENFANQMARDLSLAVYDFKYTIINGKAYFSIDGDTWNSILNYIHNYDFENAHVMANITADPSSLLPSSSSAFQLSNISGLYSIGLSSQIVSYSSSSYSSVYLPTGEVSVTLNNDGTVIKPRSTYNFSDKVVVVTAPAPNGSVYFCAGLGTRGQIVSSIDDVKQISSSNGTVLGYGADIYINGGTTPYLLSFSQSNNIWTYKLGNITLCRTNLLPAYYWVACVTSGCILCNVDNNITDVNTDTDTTTVSVPVDVEAIPPLFDEHVDDQVFVNVPVLGDLVIPGTDTVLTPEQVKDRVRDDEAVELVPNFPLYSNNDLGGPVLVTSNPVIPNDADVPLYVPGYPDVLIPAYPDVTVTANDDIFPTVSSSSGENESVTSGENESVTSGENVSEVVSEAVSDLTDTLSESDVQRGLNRMKLPQLLIKKFPFCIPFDFYNSVAVFYADAEPLSFTIPIKNSRLGIDESITVDLAQYENVAKVVRWFFAITWVAGLVLITRKVIWK